MENLNLAIRKEGALRGLLLGGILLLVDILTLYYLANWAQSFLVTFIVLYPLHYIIIFGLSLLFIKGLRDKIGKYWTLRQAITGIFIMLFITSIIWNNGVMVFSNAINPTLAEKAHIATVNAREGAMKSTHRPPAEIKAEMHKMNKTFALNRTITVQNFIRSLFVTVILLFAVSFVLGALFKRERPVAANNNS
ncbi:DUF4199 family protein [Mucilaginibacter lacusdianchii]|uniref:DUF4199 family protein n=1 Tax=Mucilaginibacter lacusdianchii TaxID=2684211 RepID=UPI00131B4D35|nr:DUF4199 domain-containing protein [Mucilaginibacter sp. JXJ CY 39]